ncbi:MAG: hypothetical protein H0V97_01205 [Actinobacteria bacterium]|nr:hypothetical protein [Actinomycetota bacterium]
MSHIELDLILAGPMLRRSERSRICIWVATSSSCDVRAEVFTGLLTGDLQPVGAGKARPVRLGRRLWVHLIEALPEGASEGERGEFPSDELLGYDLEITDDSGTSRRLGDLGLLRGPDGVTYDELPLPALVLPSQEAPLNAFHGSCRLLHGKGDDALVAADEAVSGSALDPSKRPSALFLTGDQIYADDVAGPLLVQVMRLAREIVDPNDHSKVPGVASLSTISLYGRQEIAEAEARFTSDKASNHLMSFGEFACMYLVAWNRRNWPDELDRAARVIPADEGRVSGAKKRFKYGRELKDLDRARSALPAVRRVLANVPTYMNFDDHDCTDDWNLTERWRKDVKASLTGRRIVANALATFWAFQGWGNDPDPYSGDFGATIEERDDDPDGYDDAMWSFDRWSFLAPTTPPALVLDTRTQRSFDSPEGAACLIGATERSRVLELARAANAGQDRPLIVVSAVPVCGLELQERRQKFLVRQVGPYEIDFEAWQSNLQGFVDLMCLLIEDLELESCVFLSGDVHYGLNLRFVFGIQGRALSIIQLVSSGQKHSGVASKSALNVLGKLVSRRHERVGWASQPSVRKAGWRKKVLERRVNTDEWSDDAPVFLSPKRVRSLGIEDEPDYRELRMYVEPTGPHRSLLVGENNVGLISLRNRKIVHRLLSRNRGDTTVHEATLEVTPPAPGELEFDALG